MAIITQDQLPEAMFGIPTSSLSLPNDLTKNLRPIRGFGNVAKSAAELRRTSAASPSLLIRNLDRLRLRPGEVTIWAGHNGHRKSILMGQLALDLLAQKRVVAIASPEMQMGYTFMRMTQQATTIPDVTDVEMDTVEQWFGDRLIMHNGDGDIDQALAEAICVDSAQRHKATHVILDNLMMFSDSEDHEEQKNFVRRIVRIAIKENIHIHVVAHCKKPAEDDGTKPPGKWAVAGSSSITNLAHNVVTIWANKFKGQSVNDHDDENPRRKNVASRAEALKNPKSPDAIISVEKQRNGRFEGQVPLWFDNDSLRFVATQGRIPQPYITSSVDQILND